MSFVVLLTKDPCARAAVRFQLAAPRVATARSWERLIWLVRERPVTGVIVDTEALPPGLPADVAIGDLGRRFPSLATVLAARPGADPFSLFRLGRAGLGGLVLLPADSWGSLPGAIRRALANSTAAVVTRAVSPYLPARETESVRLALAAPQHGWDAERLARQVGVTRPHASVRLKACGLPSLGHLLVWARLLHAGRWLTDPGRTAESVSRQLGYSSGAAFRRALHAYVGVTPSDLRAFGGLRQVLSRFLDECGLPDSVQGDRSVA